MFKNKPATAIWSLLMIVLCGQLCSCSDDYDLDDEGNTPSWLGNSIYEELKNPNQDVLTGTFTNYLRLIDDLGYAETLSKTGSKTVFPANDDAFSTFFANNTWGVRSYDDLTTAMKKQLLYSSMLDNAILVEMLSNVPSGTTNVSSGQALKHQTNVSVIDTVTHIDAGGILPANNPYWNAYFLSGIDMVADATRPMMVHFTREQMVANTITTTGDNSDFEVITGAPYDEAKGSSYIFRDRIVNADVTCKNGYIHQLEDVLVPPGNLAELLANSGECDYFCRMLDRFCAPFPSLTVTNNYNAYATANLLATKDLIYEKRYFSSRSHGGALTTDPDGLTFSNPLKFDPGWNGYYPSNELTDMGAMFVPTDEALKRYFLPGGAGAFLINRYGAKDNTEANLAQNIDSIPLNIVQGLINNMMNTSFVGSVPSKFNDVQNDAADPMGITLDDISRNSDGTYDVKIANNGVAYMMNTVFAPKSYSNVSAPAMYATNMHVINAAIIDGQNDLKPLNLGLNYYAYLLAMSANYALFLPTDEAFDGYYVDPAFLKHSQPRALKFYYNAATSPYVFCDAHYYDPVTGEVGEKYGTVAASDQGFKNILKDILNYHTIVLGSGETLQSGRYYKTKHGGEVYFQGNRVVSGAQIDNGQPVSNVTETYNQDNGVAYAIDHVIQAPQTSVYSLLNGDSRFSEFLSLCNGFSEELMDFASDKFSETVSGTTRKRMDAYFTFTTESGKCLDQNVNYFSSYNYTLYAPDNDAMRKAYAQGLPTWDDVRALYDEWGDKDDSDARTAARNKALAMVETINKFIRYHFQNSSVYTTATTSGKTEYGTQSVDDLGVSDKLRVSGNGSALTVEDAAGNTVTVNAQGSLMANKMTRDYVFNNVATVATYMTTSSFCAVHEIASPLHYTSGSRYDTLWSGSNAKATLATHRKQFDTTLYRLYDNQLTNKK